MRKAASRTGRSSAAAIEGLQLVVETTSWVVAWLVLPVWLALRGASAADFLLYAVGAGLLLAFAVAADRPDAFARADDIGWFAAASGTAVLLVGGFTFTIATLVV
jgi:hypothetical protein